PRARSRPHRDLHSFPTRRSSDLLALRARPPQAGDYVPTGAVVQTFFACFGFQGRPSVTPAVVEGGARLRARQALAAERAGDVRSDRKSTRLNSSHVKSSYAVFCL